MNSDGIDVVDDWSSVDTSDGPMRFYRVQPREPRQPGAAVLVLQEAFGVNAHIQDVTRRVALQGYLALAPELFHRTGGGVVDYGDRERAMSLIDALAPSQIETDVRALLTHLEAAEYLPVQRVATLGFCFGGRAAVTAATSIPGLAATVAFYGPGVVAGPHSVLDRFGSITGPVLMIVGEDDPTIPPEHVTALRDAGAAAGLDLRIQLFPHAGHAFHCDARPAAYDPRAADAAWGMTSSFLARALSDEPPATAADRAVD